jgi:hypothetical protein
MKNRKAGCQYLLCCFLLVSGMYATASGQVSYRNNLLSITHDLYQKQISITESGSGAVRVTALLDRGRRNLIHNEEEIPFFEFVLNQHKITSLDPIWRYGEHESRAMGNGGTEVKITINGVAEPARGLQLIVYEQLFPGTTLMRERIILQAQGRQTFKLSKLDGNLRFVFPQYAIPSSQPAASTEVRMATWANELIEVDECASYDERFPGGRFSDHNLAHNHMFHPRVISHSIEEGESILVKGPIQLMNLGDFQWISSYEHASQDDLRGLFKDEMTGDGNLILDAAQGTRGVFNFTISRKDLHFLGISHRQQSGYMQIAVEAIRGAYLEGEIIDAQHPYLSVWTATAFDRDTTAGRSREILLDYMWRCICEKPSSRQPEFYYNTWGMQRRLNGLGFDLRGVLTEQKIREEIGRAAELGVDIFVLDDGWEQAQGIWKPHRERLPDGLAPIKAELDKHGIKMGLWLSPMGIDSTTQRYRDHPEWVIKDTEGNPIGAQWGHPAFDFVSDFYDLFIEDCKKLVDAGARFFKWDAINTFYSTLPDLYHGSDQYTDEEIRRVMTGLAPMSMGKLFWMNNGASGYNDYTSYRAKSMRSIPSQFAGWIPLGLFTYANYPHSSGKSMRYNLNTSLVAGHGFWGALEETSVEERRFIGRTVEKCKRILPFIAGTIPEVIGRVGSSPEIYTQMNREKGAGQVIAFSGSALTCRHSIPIDAEKVLGVLNNAYQMEDEVLTLTFNFPMPESTREAFILPGQGCGISVRSSTCWLDELSFEDGTLRYVNGAPGEQVIHWDVKNGKPGWSDIPFLTLDVQQHPGYFVLHVTQAEAGLEVRISSSR